MKSEEQKFYKCEICGNLVGLIESSGVPIYCCGEEMTCLNAEKPDFEIKTDFSDGILKIDLGERAKNCDWIYLQTADGGCRKALNGENVVEFYLADKEKAERIFAYSTIFGLLSEEI